VSNLAEVDLLIAQWSVKPRPFEFSVADWRAHTSGCSTAGGLGCLSVIIVSVISALLLSRFPAAKEISSGTWWLGGTIATVILLLLLSLAAYYSRANKRNRLDAEAATSEARVRYKDIGVQAGGIATAIERAQFYLDVAAREFAQHRYAPFWDAMENAATAIGQCHTCQGYLAFDIDQYVNTLSGRLHDFPSWDHAVTSIAAVEPSLHRFAQLKNDAEADYHFASMREFRETRQVMIAGFKTLGEALRHLEHAVVDSIADLKRAVNRSLLMRAADPTHIHVVARFLISTPSSGESG
jgi:hypothetical protein